MANSATGSYATTPEHSMRAFDQLPATVRAALRDSLEDWVPQPVLTRWNRGNVAPKDLVASIQKWDRDELNKRTYQAARGLGPYKGKKPDTSVSAKPRQRSR